MIHLGDDLDRLRSFFEPWNAQKGHPIIWEPELNDPNIQAKTHIINKAKSIIVAIENKLKGLPLSVTELSDDDFNLLEESLANDSCQAAYLELAICCKSATEKLKRIGSSS